MAMSIKDLYSSMSRAVGRQNVSRRHCETRHQIAGGLEQVRSGHKLHFVAINELRSCYWLLHTERNVAARQINVVKRYEIDHILLYCAAGYLGSLILHWGRGSKVQSRLLYRITSN
jgi:hypothetical protein